MSTSKAALDAQQRARLHGEVVQQMDGIVGSEIRAQDHAAREAHAEDIEQIAHRLHGKAIRNVVETDREIERERTAARIAQVVDYLFYLVYGLLALRFLLALAGANRSAGFARFVDATTGPLYAPFKGLLASPAVQDGSAMTFATPVLVALVAYALLHGAVKGLLRVVGVRRTEI